MKFIDEFRNPELTQELAQSIRKLADKPIQIMEVCGTHTMSIARFGIKSMLGDKIKLISGPGCPVCVTPQPLIDRFITLGRQENTILTTFGDMIRVPGNKTSLEVERARGADVRIVYSPIDAVKLAANNPDKRVIFFGVGFETTAPSVAVAALEAKRLGLKNFFVLSALKVVPPALRALLSDPEVRVDGLLCPGHVSAILGMKAYEEAANDYKIPCVIAGFEPLDVLYSIYMLVKQISEGRSCVENQYVRAVSSEGNQSALKFLDSVFDREDARWRGLGIIPESGLKFKSEYKEFDAAAFLDIDTNVEDSSSGCKCGLILKGIMSPSQCPMFGKVCTPECPVGPCMVSSEGACAAEYKYSDNLLVC